MCLCIEHRADVNRDTLKVRELCTVHLKSLEVQLKWIKYLFFPPSSFKRLQSAPQQGSKPTTTAIKCPRDQCCGTESGCLDLPASFHVPGPAASGCCCKQAANSVNLCWNEQTTHWSFFSTGVLIEGSYACVLHKRSKYGLFFFLQMLLLMSDLPQQHSNRALSPFIKAYLTSSFKWPVLSRAFCQRSAGITPCRVSSTWSYCNS